MVLSDAGQKTTHTLFGTKVAVLAGDFLFAQSSWYLANLDNLEVVKLISQVCGYVRLGSFGTLVVAERHHRSLDILVEILCTASVVGY